MSRAVFRRVSAAALASACLLLASPALAWERIESFFDCGDGPMTYPLAHQWRTIPFRFAVDGAGAGWVTAAEARALVEDAADDWNGVLTSEFRSESLGATTNARLSNGKNEVFFLGEEWADVFGEGNELLGVTLTSSDRATGKLSDFTQCPSVDRCEVCPAVESDVILNATKLAAQTEARVHTVIAHEFGHVLGLGHEDTAMGGRSSLMATAPTALTLEADDEDGASSLYPADENFCEGDEDCVVGDYCALYDAVYPEIAEIGASCPRTELCARGACQAQENGREGAACLTYDDPECEGDLECTGGERPSRGYCGGTRVAPENPCEGNPLCDGTVDAGTGSGGGGSSGGCAVSDARTRSGETLVLLLAIAGLSLLPRRRRRERGDTHL